MGIYFFLTLGNNKCAFPGIRPLNNSYDEFDSQTGPNLFVNKVLDPTRYTREPETLAWIIQTWDSAGLRLMTTQGKQNGIQAKQQK